MNVEFTKTFQKSLGKIKDKKLLKAIAISVHEAEKAASQKEIHNLKKLSGFKTAYRIKIGVYRIGVRIEGKTVYFAALAHRKDIYKLFP